ncbi:sugar transferase [Sporolactobacillus pectinivorans]|uniref:sugar transferase n=1 Tax=Sporolactobacillus pectinivorans TaxID=1591408 RepID=UPI000C26AA17|nr:sugar transferase [Sporolactobacillus pectinivorans]
MALSRIEIETRYSEPAKYIKLRPLSVNESRGYLLSKRLMDIFGALLGLLLLSPVFLIVSLAVKIEEPKGKVIFKQIRVGKSGKTFHIYKFRSMVSNAEQLLDNLLIENETTGAMFKMKDDPRVTKIGHFIRRTSLDELPQFFNVLKGEMSLVGPRPPLPREVAEYTEYDKLRLTVTPGCTGLWQVSGRSELSFNEMVDLDLKYMKQRSITFDLKIILKTILVVFEMKSAY